MKKFKVVLMSIMIVCIMMTTTACSAFDGVLLFGEDVFDAIFGFIDNGPLGQFYDFLNIEGLITGEHGGNFENPNDDPEATVSVQSISLDASSAKKEFKFAEKFTFDGLKVVATMSDGSTKDISLQEVKIKEPDTTTPGVRIVVVTYEGKTARYEVTINERVLPAISNNSLVNINKENDSVPYRVEAELIDMATPGAVKVDGVDSFVATAPAGADITSGGKYLTGFGVKWNYFGFTFTAAQEYKDVTLVLRVSNSIAENISADSVNMYLNYAKDENGVVSGEISLEGYIIYAGGEWSDIVIRNLTIPAGTNTITFDVNNNKVFNIDYIDLYVGMRYINSVVEIKDSNKVVKDIETLDTEKAFTRTDVAEANGLKNGQLFVETVTKEWPGITTSGGTSVGAIGKGSLISTTLRLSEDATIRILFRAAKTTKENSSYFVDDNWSFYVDGVKLQFVEYVDIKGGDRAQAMYWEWKYTNLGEINLSAGDHSFVIEAVGTDCNVDTIEFEIISFGSYDEIGKDIDEQKHTCKDACPTCGKCTTKCNEEACADKCDGCRPEYDLIIGEEGRFYIEAEKLPLDNLVPELESTGIKVESFTGGQGIGGIKSGYQTFTIMSEKDVTVRFSVNFAKKAGGSILTYIPSVSVNGKSITLSDGTVPAGVDGNQYWNLKEIALAELELKASVKYEFRVNLTSGNLDKYIFEVIDGNGQEIEEHFDVTVATSGTTKYELENIDTSKCSVVTRQDFVNAGVCAQGEVSRGSGRIYGFDNGSVFRVYVNVTAPCTLKIGIAGFADTAKGGNPSLAAYTWKLGDTVITPSADAAINTDGTVGEATVGTVSIANAGVYVFEFSFGVRTDLDYILFEVV